MVRQARPAWCVLCLWRGRFAGIPAVCAPRTYPGGVTHDAYVSNLDSQTAMGLIGMFLADEAERSGADIRVFGAGGSIEV